MRRFNALWIFSVVVITIALCFNAVVEAEKMQAHASHILLETEKHADELMEFIEEEEELEHAFAEMAKKHSKCPSSKKGGDLGKFEPGQMVPEFDEIAFKFPVGDIHKVKTQFGWHLVLVHRREDLDKDEL